MNQAHTFPSGTLAIRANSNVELAERLNQRKILDSQFIFARKMLHFRTV